MLCDAVEMQSQNAVLDAAAEIIEARQRDGKTPTYISEKQELQNRFGEDKFALHKRQVQDMFRAAASTTATDFDPTISDGVMRRLSKLIEESESKGEQPTYVPIKAALSREFGPKAVEQHKRAINEALSTHAAAMRGHRPETTTTADVAVKQALETNADAGYHEMCAAMAPTDVYTGAEVVACVRAVRQVSLRLQAIDSFLKAPFAQLPGVDVTSLFAGWYDKLVSTELKDALNVLAAAGTNEQEALGNTVFAFKLYDAVRELEPRMRACVPGAEMAVIRLCDWRATTSGSSPT